MLNSLNKIDNSLLSSVKRLSPLNMKRSNNNYSFAFVANHLIYYPTPTSLTYAWSFGFLAGMCLLTQMIFYFLKGLCASELNPRWEG